MKAFENWWSKFDCGVEPCGDDYNFQSCCTCEKIAEIAWKAALEWALNKKVESDIRNEYEITDAAIEEIKEELEESE